MIRGTERCSVITLSPERSRALTQGHITTVGFYAHDGSRNSLRHHSEPDRREACSFRGTEAGGDFHSWRSDGVDVFPCPLRRNVAGAAAEPTPNSRLPDAAAARFGCVAPPA